MRGMDQLPKSSKKTLQKAAKYYIKKMKEMGGRFKDGVKTVCIFNFLIFWIIIGQPASYREF